MKFTNNKILLIFSLILIFVIPFGLAITINLAIFTTYIIYFLRKKTIFYDIVSFHLGYLVLSILHFSFQGIDFIPVIPVVLYSILAVVCLLSLIIKKPFICHINLSVDKKYSKRDYLRSNLWLFSFVLSAVTSGLLIPNYLYLIIPMSFIFATIIIDII